MLAVLALAVLSTGQTWPDDLFEGSAGVSVSFSGDDYDVGVGVRASWTRLRTAMPMGVDLEARWLFRAGALRILPAFHAYPFEAGSLGSNECLATQTVRLRGTRLSIDPALAITAGAVVELGSAGPGWGAMAGARGTVALLGLPLRATWMFGRGPELDAAVELRMPSIMGDSDVLITCN